MTLKHCSWTKPMTLKQYLPTGVLIFITLRGEKPAQNQQQTTLYNALCCCSSWLSTGFYSLRAMCEFYSTAAQSNEVYD